MLARVALIALNTYREAVRARVLHGLFALALATGAYSFVVGAFALGNSTRVVSDFGSASISLYSVIVAVVLGATSLYRELELKTIFPILARPVRRSEYLVGKYLGAVLTLSVFVTANAGALMLALGQVDAPRLGAVASLLVAAVVVAIAAWRRPRVRTYLPIPCALGLFVGGYLLGGEVIDDRRVIVGNALLTLCEVGIVSALATLFASFSTPFLTAVMTFGLFIVGRSAETLASLPVKVFGPAIQGAGRFLSQVLPNLMLYVPPRPLLTGEATGTSLPEYTALAALHALAWSAGLLAVAALVFRRRDFL